MALTFWLSVLKKQIKNRKKNKMNKNLKKLLGLFAIIIPMILISALLAKLIGISTNEMLLYILIGDYAQRLYDDIVDS